MVGIDEPGKHRLNSIARHGSVEPQQAGVEEIRPVGPAVVVVVGQAEVQAAESHFRIQIPGDSVQADRVGFAGNLHAIGFTGLHPAKGGLAGAVEQGGFYFEKKARGGYFRTGRLGAGSEQGVEADKFLLAEGVAKERQVKGEGCGRAWKR